jgi:hypothetical protein
MKTLKTMCLTKHLLAERCLEWMYINDYYLLEIYPTLLWVSTVAYPTGLQRYPVSF